jgi:ferredoxin
MAVVKADVERCEGYANCVIGAPSVFDLDDDGLVLLLKRDISEDERTHVEEAARSCPVNALTVEDE